MLKRSLLFGALVSVGAIPTATVAAAVDSEFRTVTVQAGQGDSISIEVPVALKIEAPYALSGKGPQVESRAVPVRFGQGDLVWVRVGR